MFGVNLLTTASTILNQTHLIISPINLGYYKKRIAQVALNLQIMLLKRVRRGGGLYQTKKIKGKERDCDKREARISIIWINQGNYQLLG